MSLPELSFSDPRLVLVPIEALSETGVSDAFATLAAPHGFDAPRRALFDAGFARYFARGEDLGRRTVTWPMPRLRHVAIVGEPHAVRPYAQLLNTSAWTLYASDLDPASSDPELVAYLLTLGDRMTLSGEVASAPLHAAAYWFDRTADEIAAFVAAAGRSSRPDAALLRAVAAAIPWLRELRHETLRSPASSAAHRGIPGSGLLVPPALEARPPALVEECAEAARQALGAFHAAWRRTDRAATDTLVAWLASAAPRLLVTSQGGRIVWDADAPGRVNALARELRDADAVAVASVQADLRVIERCTRAAHAAFTDPGALPAPDADSAQSGYSYLHRERGLIAYNLHEPGMERLRGPGLPFARAMLAARTAHEWAHLAVDAGWVPRIVDDATYDGRVRALAEEMERVIAAAPPAVQALTAADRAALAGSGTSVGEALARIVLGRMPDYRPTSSPCASSIRSSARCTSATTSGACVTSIRPHVSGPCSRATCTSTSTSASAPSRIDAATSRAAPGSTATSSRAARSTRRPSTVWRRTSPLSARRTPSTRAESADRSDARGRRVSARRSGSASAGPAADPAPTTVAAIPSAPGTPRPPALPCAPR